MGYPFTPLTVTLTDDFNLFFEKTVDFYYNIWYNINCSRGMA